jgi:RNA polymerase sigma-70 factor (ECF subfamily)
VDPDAALMQAFQRGDESAFEQLVERHRARVLRLAYRYLGNEAAAEDLAQEAFLRVYRARHRWQPKAKFSTWLYRVTANACLNELRARRVRKAVEATAPTGPSGEPLFEAVDEKTAAPDQALLHLETATVVREAVQKLPDDQRLVVVLNKYEGLSYRELADAMNRSVPAIKSLLVRARENLRKQLEPYLSRAAEAGEAATPMSPDERRKRERQSARESKTSVRSRATTQRGPKENDA